MKPNPARAGSVAARTRARGVAARTRHARCLSPLEPGTRGVCRRSNPARAGSVAARTQHARCLSPLEPSTRGVCRRSNPARAGSVAARTQHARGLSPLEPRRAVSVAARTQHARGLSPLEPGRAVPTLEPGTAVLPLGSCAPPHVCRDDRRPEVAAIQGLRENTLGERGRDVPRPRHPHLFDELALQGDDHFEGPAVECTRRADAQVLGMREFFGAPYAHDLPGEG